MIKEGENELHFKVDDVEYDITLDPAYYGSDTLINELNKKLQEVSGSARDDVFFREYGEEKVGKGVNIQLSSEKGDYVEIPRTEVSTTLLGINSICISKVKYATKAVDRISEAISKLSDIRSVLGSSQNKLEHAINSNENKAENTTAAESRIRDTDMAEMMMEQAKLNILQQAGEAMLAQANTAKDVSIKFFKNPINFQKRCIIKDMIEKSIGIIYNIFMKSNGKILNILCKRSTKLHIDV